MKADCTGHNVSKVGDQALGQAVRGVFDHANEREKSRTGAAKAHAKITGADARAATQLHHDVNKDPNSTGEQKGEAKQNIDKQNDRHDDALKTLQNIANSSILPVPQIDLTDKSVETIEDSGAGLG